MAAVNAEPAARAGDEGTVAPILSAHFSTSHDTSLVLEIGSTVPCDRAVQVVVFELSGAARSSDRPLNWRARLVGSRVVTKAVAAPGETLRLPVPSEAFGSMDALGALLIPDSAVGNPAGAAAFTSIAVPLLDPAKPLAVPPEPGSIVVTEFMKDPAAVSDVRGEWLELRNRTTKPLNLEGWTLRHDGSNNTVIVAEVAGEGVVVPPGAFVVLARNGDPALNGGVTADAVYSGFTLGNGADQIILEAPGGFVIDRVDYLDAGAEGWPDASGASIALSPRFTGLPAAALGSSWCSGTDPMPLGDFGTPGSENSDC